MKNIFSFIIVVLFSLYQTNAQDETRLMKFPNANQSEITFSYAGDIFTVPIAGGIARRITSGNGIDLFPRFSPDGEWIAFSGNYDGNQEVYIVPSVGGTPKRLTYSSDIGKMPERMGPDKIIMQWGWDSKHILYRGRQDSWNSLVGNGYMVNIDGSLPVELPLPRMGFFSLPPSGDMIVFNRIFREFRTWKRYSGGQSDDIWIYTGDNKTENITNNPAQDIIPMAFGRNVYFLSDRDRTMNLFVYNLDSKETRKLTNFTEYDVKFPSLNLFYIAFTNGGYIYTMDLKTEEVKKVNVIINEDFPNTRPAITNVSKNIENSEISPDGKFGLFAARGEIFVVPAEKGNIINLTNSIGVHDRNPKWSPNGKWISFISDKSGEDEIYLIKPDGSALTQLTNDAKSYRWETEWSPDSKYLLNSDKLMNLYLIDVATKVSKVIAHSTTWEIRDFSFSSDSKWITYSDSKKNDLSQVFLYSIADGKTTAVTSEFFDSSQPVWDPEGKYLFFVSGRNFQGKTGNFEYNYMFEDMQNIFGVTLSESTSNPFVTYETDLKVEDDKVITDDIPKKKSKKNKDEVEENSLKIDLNNLSERIFEIPSPSGNYYGFYVFDNKLYYARSSAASGSKLYTFDFEKKEESEIGDARNYRISTDGKSILFAKGQDYYITKLSSKIDTKEGKLNFEKMEVLLNRKAEWEQIFNEAWRQFKYFFYDPNMHGVDWNKIKERYVQLVPYVNHRVDLTYLIGEMIGELDVGHAYVSGGDMPAVDEVKIGLLGARFTHDENTGFYKISKIYEGRNWDEKTRSPLTEPGIDVKVGDFLIAIDDIPLSKTNTPFAALNNKANEYVKLTYNTSASKDGAKEVWVKTIDNEANLMYFNWVEHNRKYVEKATNGRIGYIHIPDMGFGNGLLEFVKYFYPQLDKEGLIIDDRYNGGGNVSSMIAERLRREVAVARHARNQEVIGTTPGAVMPGPFVCLVNQQSMSDGDLFPYQFRKYGLGKIIGMRTWGGVIGIRGSLPFTDGSNLHKPEFANFGPDGTWILEDEGITPDIIIENDPAKEWEGIDEQLDKAIEVILEEVKTNQKQQVPKTTPPFPIR